MSDLHLSVKRVYFDNIKARCKGEEYRLDNEYWRKRLLGKTFDNVIITLGYPPAGDLSRTLMFEWNGHPLKNLTHPHFGPTEVRVFAIDLSKSIDLE